MATCMELLKPLHLTTFARSVTLFNYRMSSRKFATHVYTSGLILKSRWVWFDGKQVQHKASAPPRRPYSISSGVQVGFHPVQAKNVLISWKGLG